MIASYRLKSAPTDRPVDKSSFLRYKYIWVPASRSTCCLGIKEHHVDNFSMNKEL